MKVREIGLKAGVMWGIRTENEHGKFKLTLGTSWGLLLK